MEKNNLTFREVTEQDYAFLIALRRATMNPHYIQMGKTPDEQINAQRVLDHYESTRIIVLEGVSVGMVKAYSEGSDWILSQIQVKADYQGRGIGTAVVKQIIDTAPENTKGVRLSVLKGNRAIKLYQRLGFKIAEEGDSFYRLLFQLDLSKK